MIDLKNRYNGERQYRFVALYGYCTLICALALMGGADSSATPICPKEGGQPTQTIFVTEFGAIGDGKADETAAFQQAIACLHGYGSVYVPSGIYLVKSDIQVNYGVKLYGDGYSTQLILDGAAIVVNGGSRKGGVEHWQLSDFRVTRIGYAGPAIKMTGSDVIGNNRGAIRGFTRNIYVEGSTGDGVELSNAYLITNENLIVRHSAGAAINMKLGPAGLVSANSITFLGGEIQQNGIAVIANSAVGITFVGVAIEGNGVGVDLVSNNRSFAFYNCYFEWNGSFDIRAGTGKQGAVGLVIDNGYFADARAGKDYSIVLVKAAGVDVRSSIFSGYATSAINIPAAGNAVRGMYGNLTMGAGTPSACVKSNELFYEVDGKRGIQFNPELQRALSSRSSD